MDVISYSDTRARLRRRGLAGVDPEVLQGRVRRDEPAVVVGPVQHPIVPGDQGVIADPKLGIGAGVHDGALALQDDRLAGGCVPAAAVRHGDGEVACAAIVGGAGHTAIGDEHGPPPDLDPADIVEDLGVDFLRRLRCLGEGDARQGRQGQGEDQGFAHGMSLWAKDLTRQRAGWMHVLLPL